ncbi:glycoside hydrolase family 31 protein [Lactobacillus hamsteri]|uniref:Alpha-glucosidase n=1 Tax=Lactobacillus hamsteri DSM 5661 = JCM 6256 TaxID=1423754 RepID=A0A0R1YJU1_9LACO|nr:TIM-barrel domain-containing protein [Lactobacillus hamsteri]KRM39452.1 alpha-glucosidase [Lactobacillus hamsteri DSM 5661 = JCM 6256]
MTQDTQFNRHQLGQLLGANKRDHYYELHYATGEVARLYILADGIFRYFLDPSKKFDENHSSLVNLEQFNNQYFEKSRPRATSDSLIIQSGSYQLIFQQKPAIMTIFDESLHRTRLVQLSPIELGTDQSTEILKQNKNEFYFGGGLQNGSFSHKGKRIDIKHDNITGDGGVLSQVPFFWSNAGFGEFRNSMANGEYDFGKVNENAAMITHNTPIFDNFYLIGNSSKDILRKYFVLTGQPLMPPKYALELGHIGNFLTTKWKPSEAKERAAQMFEDGNYYLRTNNDDEVIGKASLNGEEQYQFSARAMIDRYQKQHFDLGWMIPNFGTNDVNDDALELFNEYAETHGVEAGLWTDQNKDNFVKNTSFIATNTYDEKVLDKDTQMLKNNLNRRRPLIFANTANAGSQKFSALIFGDSGGNWENTRTQVAGFLGANLSGEPLVGCGVDGNNGGGNAQISIRDFQWKAFTPLLFNIDDQGKFSKSPFAYNNKMTRINRAYLELRKQLKNYLYTLVYQAQNGEPIIRALFIDFPHEQINYTEQVDHEFMLGPNLLISPITNGREDGNGNSRKDNLYLPDHRTMWIDLFTGKKYLGGRVYNKLSYPVWHLPVFVRGGSIFDLGKRNYVFYPQGMSQISFYDDNDYTDFAHKHSETKITSDLESSKLTITIDPTKGEFNGMEDESTTNLNIMCDSYPDGLTVKINDQVINMQEYGTVDTFAHAKEGFFYNTNYSWMPEFDSYNEPKQTALQIKLAKRDITDSKITITIQNFNYGGQTLVHSITDSVLRAPKLPTINPEDITAHSLTINWPKVTDKVQVEMNGILYDGIDGDSFTFHELTPNTKYILRLRNVAGNKVSEWSDPFGAITKKAAIDYAIQNIHVTSNYEAKDGHPLSYLTDLKLASEWEVKDKFDETKPLTLTFNFEKEEKLSRMAFVPRNIDHDGDPIEVGMEISKDGNEFKPYGDRYTWKADAKNKVIGLRDVTAKAIRLTVYKSSGSTVAGKEVMFFKDKNSVDE